MTPSKNTDRFYLGESMLLAIRDLLKTRTARNTLMLFSGTVLAKTMAFGLVCILIPWQLGRSDYDVFGMGLTLMWFVLEITELGLITTTVRHATGHLQAGRTDRAAGIFRFTALIKLGLYIAVFTAGALLAELAADVFMEGRGRPVHVFIALAGGLGLSSIYLLNGYYQSARHFHKEPILLLVQNLLKAGAVGALILASAFTLDSALAIYGAVPWITVLAGALLLPRELRRRGVLTREDIRAMASFGLVNGAVFMLVSIENRFGLFLLGHAGEVGEVGDYFLAQQLNLPFFFAIYAYSSVMVAKVSAVKDLGEVLRVQRRSLMPLAMFATGAALAIVLAGPLVQMFLPARYFGAVGATRWFFAATIVTVVGLPGTMILMHLRRLRGLLAGHLLGLPLLVGLGLLWLDPHGAAGLAAAFAVHMAVANLAFIAFAFWEVRRNRERG